MLNHDSLVAHFTEKFKPVEPLDVKALHPEAHIKHLTGADVDQWREYLHSIDGTLEEQTTFWMIATLCNVEGSLLFPIDWSNKETVKKQLDGYTQILLSLPLGVFNDVGGRIYRANGMTGDSEETEKKD
jgi:hypothetical protein